ncbi:MAG: hypothetical protein LC768_03510 [Acidobacteria bacterium]|nr:hypothetical protein [Acidobacteriota bacterium]MCA1637395.1 hypothetical protein [Acidobacteriota bacterium]
MNTKTFNENYELDRKAKGVRANPKHTRAEEPEIVTADGTVYDSTQTYYFFDAPTAEIKQSVGLRRDGEYLCTFGLKVIPISNLRAKRDDALADGQVFFNSEIERLRNWIKDFELEKTTQALSHKPVLSQ